MKYDIPSEIYISPLRSNIQTFVYLKAQFINEELQAQLVCHEPPPTPPVEGGKGSFVTYEIPPENDFYPLSQINLKIWINLPNK